jgi:hypothetical protein
LRALNHLKKYPIFKFLTEINRFILVLVSMETALIGQIQTNIKFMRVYRENGATTIIIMTFDTQHSNTQHKVLTCETLHKWRQYKWHYDNTYNDFTYNNFTYNTNKCNITNVFLFAVITYFNYTLLFFNSKWKHYLWHCL